mmetsp:Transcript_8649/g.7674  ORF Transcript_8649/g.7674 Transcript_8649/m.7674 type:complete len:106 (+) Transcript_8649:33-350(+)
MLLLTSALKQLKVKTNKVNFQSSFKNKHNDESAEYNIDRSQNENSESFTSSGFKLVKKGKRELDRPNNQKEKSLEGSSFIKQENDSESDIIVTREDQTCKSKVKR